MSVCFTTIDAGVRLRNLPFVSAGDRLVFIAQAHCVYLAAVLALGAIALLLALVLRSLLLRKRALEELSLTVFLGISLFSVMLGATPVEASLRGIANAAGLLLLAASGLAAAIPLTRLLLFFRMRLPKGIWILSAVTILASIVLPLSALRPSHGDAGRGAMPLPPFPSVVLIVIDALRPDELSCYGAEATSTPNIDRFAASSALFTNATSSSSWTKTSIASLFSSMSPSRHGVLGESDALDDRVPTLVELLEERGYLTAAFVGNPWLAPLFGFSRGFGLYFDRFHRLRRLLPLEQVYRKRILTPLAFPDGEEILTKAAEWIRANRETPFFLYLHLMDVHDPYLPPPPYDRMYLPKEFSSLTRRELGQLEKRFRTVSADSTLLPLARALFRGGVSHADHLIGGFLTFLEREGLFDESLILLTADHGEEFLEHGKTTHGKSLYEEVLRVPLIGHFPTSLTRGMLIEAPVALIDVAPTVLELACAEVPAGAQGMSLLSFLRREDRESARFVGRARVSEVKTREGLLRCVVERDWKIIMTSDEKGVPQSLELYDLAHDPGELEDLSHVRMDVLERLLPLLPGDLPERPGAREIPPGMKERLRALGYVWDD